MRLTTTFLAAVLSLATFASTSDAGLVLVIDDLSTVGIDIIVLDDFDGGAGSPTAAGNSTHADGISGDGVVSYTGSIGAFNLQISAGTSKPIIGNSSLARLDLFNMSVSSKAAGKLLIMVTDTDYALVLKNTRRFSLGIGGTTDGTVVSKAYYDTANVEFGTGATIDSGSLTGNPFSFRGYKPISMVNKFSMTVMAQITHKAGQATSFDALAQVPEPASLALIGLGFAGIASRRRRKTIA